MHASNPDVCVACRSGYHLHSDGSCYHGAEHVCVFVGNCVMFLASANKSIRIYISVRIWSYYAPLLSSGTNRMVISAGPLIYIMASNFNAA